jgi:hypothetical protein
VSAKPDQLHDGLIRARLVAQELGYLDPAGGLQSAAQGLAEASLTTDPADLARRVLTLAEQPRDPS